MDPDRLDEIVAAIPSGRWMSYGDVARAAGGTDRHARALNQRFIRDGDARRAPRAQERRQRSAGPRWATRREVRRRLESEGLEFEGGRADPAARLRPAAAGEPDGAAERGRRVSVAGRSRLTRATQSAGVLPRPPLPPGPYLVVGLARSGVAAALALRALGARGGGRRRGPVPDAAARAELEAAGVAGPRRHAGLELLAGVATVVKSPGVPAEAPVDRRGARGAGVARARRARARLAAACPTSRSRSPARTARRRRSS